MPRLKEVHPGSELMGRTRRTNCVAPRKSPGVYPLVLRLPDSIVSRYRGSCFAVNVSVFSPHLSSKPPNGTAMMTFRLTFPKKSVTSDRVESPAMLK